MAADPQNMQSFFEKVREVVRKNNSAKQVNLIRAARPGHPRLGKLSPSHRCKFGVQQSGDGPLENALAVGEASSLEENQCLDR